MKTFLTKKNNLYITNIIWAP